MSILWCVCVYVWLITWFDSHGCVLKYHVGIKSLLNTHLVCRSDVGCYVCFLSGSRRKPFKSHPCFQEVFGIVVGKTARNNPLKLLNFVGVTLCSFNVHTLLEMMKQYDNRKISTYFNHPSEWKSKQLRNSLALPTLAICAMCEAEGTMVGIWPSKLGNDTTNLCWVHVWWFCRMGVPPNHHMVLWFIYTK